ncbi:MAG: DUF2079 domain-containing protein [Candidatus Eiseniibacteriota bacterium]
MSDRRKPGAARLTARIDGICERHGRVVLAAMIVAWTAVFSTFTWLKYRYYLYSDIDLAMFVQAVDGLLHGTMYSSIRGLNWLGDHSSLILFLVAPLYAVARHPATLPVLQCAALALGAIPVFALARLELGGGLVPLGFAALYLLHPAPGYTALYEFHPEVLCTGLLMAAFACYRAGRFAPTLAFAALALLGKEDIVLPVGAFALYALCVRRPGRLRYAAGLGGLALLFFVLSFAVLKPILGAGEVDYGRMYQQWGETPREVALGLLRRPLEAVGAFLLSPGNKDDTTLKLQYHLHMLLPLGFLPLASPLTLAMAVPTLASHFLSWRPAQHTIYYQYTAMVTPIAVAAAVLGMRSLLRRPAPRRKEGGGEARAWRGPPWLAHAVMVTLLGASVFSNWMFGPLIGHGRWQRVAAEESITPSGRDRALTRYRDAMMASLGRRDSVLAGFEFLTRLAARRHTRSFHNVVGGTHTFSTRPYPVPDDVTALIADVSHVRLRPYGNRTTGARFRELVERNRLGLVGAAGDLLLYLRDAPDSVRIWQVGEAPVAHPCRVVFDRQLAYLGDEYLAPTVEPGGLFPVRTFWRKVAPTDSLYIVQLTAYDAFKKPAFSTMHYVGYMLHPAGGWPDTTMVAETWRMIVPDDAKPGTYMLGMLVGRRDQMDQVLCETDDPAVRAQNNVVELGRFTITPRR